MSSDSEDEPLGSEKANPGEIDATERDVYLRAFGGSDGLNSPRDTSYMPPAAMFDEVLVRQKQTVANQQLTINELDAWKERLDKLEAELDEDLEKADNLDKETEKLMAQKQIQHKAIIIEKTRTVSQSKAPNITDECALLIGSGSG